ncbi:MAG: phenylacetate-CoA oxygenase subunit PaaJ [Haliea sp.]|nr:phenylacetate-CoA oxygenase subunit PaaJ [Haliea sp.]
MADPAIIPALPAEEYERRERRVNSSLQSLWDLLDAVKDPEIPAVSLWEMGILQDIAMQGDRVIVTITPTYSGCPAMTVMAEDVLQALADAGYADSEVVTRLSPAWSTSWMSEEAQDKLREYGIAPPGQGGGNEPVEVLCPRCHSDEVRRLSEFGSTACKALYQCSACGEPFDHFKPI